MNFKNSLSQLLQKYPFIHIDMLGDLSIIVPLTGAQRITDNFSKDVSLYLFGDNTCKSDLERRKFFGALDASAFEYLFPALIRELNNLNNLSGITVDEQQFLQTIISNLYDFQQKANEFQIKNPGHQIMQYDLEHSDEIFVSKGEFIVSVIPDYWRHLDLPNIMSLSGNTAQAYQKIIPAEMLEDCLEALFHIQTAAKVDRISLIARIIKNISEGQAFLRGEDENPKQLFIAIYEAMRKEDPSLKEQIPEIFKNMEENWPFVYVADDDETHESWTEQNRIEAIQSIFKQANILQEPTEVKQKTFEIIYQLALAGYQERNPDPQNFNLQRTSTFQLFTLQTFLYLCAIKLRIKNKESAQSFLKIFQDKNELHHLITQLCTNEKEFMNMMRDRFYLSAEEYQSVADATYEIAMAHIDADHFDELRIACTTQSLDNAHYIVMGSRLCWSTTPITEDTNINSPKMQKEVSASHFEIFYNKREAYVKESRAFQQIKSLFTKNVTDPKIRQEFISHIKNLSNNQKQELLVKAIKEKKSQHAQLLIENSNEGFFPYAFVTALNEDPALVKAFLSADSEYSRYIKGKNLHLAARDGDLEQVKLILQHRPELLEYEDKFKQTPLLWACLTGKAEVVKYLMDAGANIHVRTRAPWNYEYSRSETSMGRSAMQWAKALNEKDPLNSALILTLFDNYHEQMERNFAADPEYKNRFDASHLTRAIEGGDLKLVEMFQKHCPQLKVSEDDFQRTTKQFAQQQLLDQLLPYQAQFNELLEKIQIKAAEFKLNYYSTSTARQAIELLSSQLAYARNKFFFSEITAESFQNFAKECHEALEKAKPILAEHRGWHDFPVVVRAIVGILSALAVIPALAVQIASKKGYVGMFFKNKEEIKTASTKILEQFEKNLEAVKTDMSGKIGK
ncbi:Dot/Icm T4SS effector AnkF/LegA14/Ceg31 [Legionella clemsonensis]|uniref:Ankyrin repeats (3 copies) n=1 Tax=Legionella clemsonensis TaxID=1867846 RepID=A0A222NYH7_9GAMM|nr:Dot/Icm T4SS effector AnkF/LegA14/Ceg31 [Legionella clemsonensis]ASQ44631.1 Ankyrin repeats (3 copies) [Legionella clemsonensis]